MNLITNKTISKLEQSLFEDEEEKLIFESDCYKMSKPKYIFTIINNNYKEGRKLRI